MRDQMINHGLDEPAIGANTGYFEITFPGPGDDDRRLRVPESRLLVTPSKEARLNERQRAIVLHVLENGSVASGWCRERFGVAYQTVYRDLSGLLELGILRRTGSGRATRYVMGEE
jgi:predicted HTH transcriptional regulator